MVSPVARYLSYVTGSPEHRIRTAVRKLKELGLLEIKPSVGRGNANEYRLCLTRTFVTKKEFVAAERAKKALNSHPDPMHEPEVPEMEAEEAVLPEASEDIDVLVKASEDIDPVEPEESVPAHATVATTTEEPSKRRMVGNDTFVYDTREDARAAAIAKGFDLEDDVAVTTALGKWGWFVLAELDGFSKPEASKDIDPVKPEGSVSWLLRLPLPPSRSHDPDLRRRPFP
jgi:hypothetical protein